MPNDPTQLELIRKDLDRYTDLDTLARSKGGELLIGALTSDILASISRLSSGARTLTETELRALALSMSANMDLLHTLTRAEKNKDLARERLSEAVQE